MLNKLLCKINLHKWIYNSENFVVVDSYGRKQDSKFKTRECKKCNKKQFYTKKPSYNGFNDNSWKTIN